MGTDKAKPSQAATGVDGQHPAPVAPGATGSAQGLGESGYALPEPTTPLRAEEGVAHFDAPARARSHGALTGHTQTAVEAMLTDISSRAMLGQADVPRQGYLSNDPARFDQLDPPKPGLADSDDGNDLILDEALPGSLMARISHLLPAMRKSEQQVASYVLARPYDVLEMSIAGLGEAVGVSQPTVARFCNAVGFSGFKTFKLRLAQSLAAGMPYIHRDVEAHDSPSDLGSKVIDQTIAALVQVRNQLDPEQLRIALELLAQARRIEFFGLGNSGIVAQDGQHKFFRYGRATAAHSDPHVQGMAAALLSRGDVVIAISASGRTSDLLRSVDIARQAGAAIIGITRSNTPLASACDALLAADVAEDTDIYTPMTSRLAHLVLLDVLSVGIAVRGGQKMSERLAKLKQTLRERRVPGYLKLGIGGVRGGRHDD